MTRPHALMESMPASANLNESPHSIDADLTKPRNRKKFLRDGLVGPPLTGRPAVRRMARERKVPGLGDLKILEWLFKNHRSQRQLNDLYFFVTPRILK